MSMKDAYEKKLEAQLHEWSAEIAKLKAQAEDAEGDVQLEYYKQVEELRSMQEGATEKLTELKDAGDNAWEDLKAGVENARNSLDAGLKSAAAKFK